MATPPTLAADYATAFDTTLPNTVAVTAASGTTLVAIGVNSEWATNTQNVSAPTGGPTWTARYSHSGTGSACDIVASTATSTGNFTHSQTSTGSGMMCGGAVWVYSGSDGYDNAAGGYTTTEPPQISVTPTTDNCALVYMGADYQAASDVARDYLTVNGGAATEDVYFRDASYFTVYAAHWADTGTAGSKTAGLNTSAATMEVSHVVVAIKGTAGGTGYTQTLTGGGTPAGALVKQANLVKAGAGTPAGTLLKTDSQLLTGSAGTPAGALLKLVAQLLAGSAGTPAGALSQIRAVLQTLTGSAGTPAGALVKQAQLVKTGSAGTPTGGLVHSVAQLVAGAATPAGALLKAVSKLITGSAGTPSGALTNIRAALQTLTGSIGSAGALIKAASKTVTGSAGTPTGALVKDASQTLTGAVTPTGALLKAVSKLLAGAVSTITGAVSNSNSGAFVVAQFGSRSLRRRYDQKPIARRYSNRSVARRYDNTDASRRY